MSPASARLRPCLAPLWHTVALIALIVAVAAAGTVLSASSAAAPVAPRPGPFVVFAQIVAVQLGLVAYVSRVGWGRWVLRELLGAGWTDARRAAVDLLFAMGAALLVIGLETAWWTLVGARPDAAGRAFLPHTASEKAAWILVAVIVGVAEEIVHRGYLQTQLAARTRSPLLGCSVAAVLFGLAHLEQGAPAAARAAVYGLVLGLVALRRRSLVPGILAHVAIDVLAGLVGR